MRPSRGRGTVLDALASPRLATVLIALTLVLVVAGVLIPQVDYLGPEDAAAWRAADPLLASAAAAVGLDRVFTQPYFLLTVGLLAMNLAACTLRRFIKREHVVRPKALGLNAALKRGLVFWPVDATTDDCADACASALKGCGLRVGRTDTADHVSLIAYGGSFGIWGSMAFHVALLSVVVGSIWGALTTFQGDLVLTEGQVTRITPGAFVAVGRRPVFGGLPSGFSVALDDLRFAYRGAEVVDATADMRVLDGDRTLRRGRYYVNYPLEHKGLSLLLRRAGHSVRLIVREKGRIVDDTFVALDTRVAEGYSDTYRFPSGKALAILVVSDAAARLGRQADTPLDLKDPAAYLSPSKKGSRLVGPVRVGETTRVAGMDVTVADVKLYNQFLARSVGGRPFLYTGFWLAVLGTIVRFLDPKRALAVVIRKGVRGSSEVAVRAQGRYGRLGLARAMARVSATIGLPEEAWENDDA